MEYTFTTDNFETEVLGSDVPVLVDFWATWCMPCRMLAPVIEEIASENEGKIKVGKVNVDENPDLARKYRVMSIPTVLVFKNGELTATSVGVDSKENSETAGEINRSLQKNPPVSGMSSDTGGFSAVTASRRI